MNYRLLSKVLGLLLLLLSATMVFCLAYAYWTEERRPGMDAVESFLLSIAITTLAAVALLFLGWRSGREILRKEAVAIVGLGWVVSAVFGALPYIFSDPNLGPVESLFESMSGFTTTGASVIQDLSLFPRSLLLWRSITQWLGGLGILVLFVALLTYLGVGSKALFGHESSAKSGEGLQARIRDVAARLWLIYVGFSGICCVGLMLLGMSFYDALNHTLCTISTGGFSPHNKSIAAFDSVGIELWLILFMIIGGISFMSYAWLLQGKWDRWKKDEEHRLFLLILGIAAAIIAVDLFIAEDYATFGQSLRAAAFQVVSIMTTTGFVTENFDQWPAPSRIVLILLMAIGGCAGSTSGGIKVGRWLLFFRIVRLEVVAAFRPKQVIALHLNGALADDSLQKQTVFFVALAGMTVSLGTAVVALLEPGLDMVSSFSAVVATLFNIGPGLGAIGPVQNFAHLSGPTLLFLSLLMVLGRLEFFAILVLFVPALWKRY